MTSAADIPGLVVDDAPDRPAYRPRVTFARTFPAVDTALRVLAPEEAEKFARRVRFACGRSEDDEISVAELLGDDIDPMALEDELAQLLGYYYSEAIQLLNPEIAEYSEAVAKRLESGDDSDLADKR